MKLLKKSISVMLTALMTLAMTIPAFGAAETTPAGVKHKYEVYQIFTGDFSGDDTNPVLSNVKWGSNAKLPAGVDIGDDVSKNTLDTLTGERFAAQSENKQAAELATYANFNSEPVQFGDKSYIEVEGAGDITVNVSAPGYYLVRDVPGSQEGDNANYALYMVRVVNNELTIKAKVGVPEVDKNIKVNGEDKKDSNGAIGDKVNYEFIGTMPDNIDLYNTYFYKFTDTLSKGLDYNNDIRVVIRNGNDDVDVTSYFYKQVSAYNEITGTTITVGMKDIKVLTFSDETYQPIATIAKDTKVVVTYSATIRDNAVIGDKGNPNKVDLEYSNNPNESGTGTTPPPETPDEPTPDHPTGKTPESQVVTYTTELAIHKTMEGSDLPTGVEFTLKGINLNKVNVETGEQFIEAEDGTYYKLADGTYTEQKPVEDSETQKGNSEYYANDGKLYKKVGTSNTVTVPVADKQVTAAVGEDGYLTFAGLSEGEYTLEETKTPDGYNTINPIKIVITYQNGKFTVKWTQTDENNNVQSGNGLTGDKNVIADDQDNTFSTEILNKKGSLLPSTGGIGTTIFYIVGGILVVGAAILLVTKKRMSREA